MIRIIEAGGSPKDMGRSIGRAVAHSIHDAVIAHPEFAETARLFRGTAYLKALSDAAREAFPGYMTELDAMADGADVDPEILFIWNCRGDLRFPPETASARLDALSDGCTTLLSPGDFSAGIPGVIAHNEDGSDNFMAHRYWLKATPDDAPGFESYLYPGMLAGHSVAVNGAGLVQTINNIRPDDLKPGIPRHFICRAILDAETIPQAVGHLVRKDRASGFHHAIGAAGEAQPLSVEAPASGAVIRPVTKPLAHANHLTDSYFKNLDQHVTASSRYRQQTVDGYLDGGGDPNTPEAILFQREGDGGECVLRRPGDGGDDYGCTLATAVFRIFPDRVDWTVHGGPDQLDAVTGSRSA